VFGHAEIARLFVRVGEGMSLRAASRDLREHLLRLAGGEPSRAANLAVNYLDVGQQHARESQLAASRPGPNHAPKPVQAGDKTREEA
jgi:hypothetical protein